MDKCSQCGAGTGMYHASQPICIACDAERQKKIEARSAESGRSTLERVAPSSGPR